MASSHGDVMGWTNPWVLGAIIGGLLTLCVFVVIENRVTDPMFHLDLFKIRAFTAGNIAALWLPWAGRPPIHSDHLAAGNLAPAARLPVRSRPALGRHLSAAAHHRLPGLGAHLRSSWPTHWSSSQAFMSP